MRHPLSIPLVLLGILSTASLAVSGCARNEAAEQKAMPPLPQVTVAAAISRKVTEFDEFTGRFEAVERVEVRPRVSGYISSVNFTDGSEIKKGDVLFVIDPRPYVAERDKARAQLAQARSQLALARSERDRATQLVSQHAISREEFDTRTSGSEQAQANVEAAQAALDAAGRNPVQVGLADESGYPHQGVMVFVDNALDPATGTIRSRALLDNRDRLFTPGLFARLRLLGAHEHEAVLINDSAVGTDQTVRYVLVVSAANKAEYRPVQLGPIVDGLRVVESGLASGETIVVNGLQRV